MGRPSNRPAHSGEAEDRPRSAPGAHRSMHPELRRPCCIRKTRGGRLRPRRRAAARRRINHRRDGGSLEERRTPRTISPTERRLTREDGEETNRPTDVVGRRNGGAGLSKSNASLMNAHEPAAQVKVIRSASWPPRED